MVTLKLPVGRLLTTVVAFATLLSLLALSTPSARAADNAYIRFIHAAPALDNIDIFIDGKAFRENLAFATLTQTYSYDTYASGTHTVQIAAAGQGVDKAVIKQDVTFSPNTAYTLAPTGTDTASLALLSFTDDNAIAQPGLAKARLYHLCPDCGTLNIALSNIPQPINGITYKSASDYVYIPGANYTITGTLPNGQQVPFETNIDANAVSSAFVVGTTQGAKKLQLVGAEVKPTPSLPNTGSDPNAPKPQAALPWSILALLIAGAIILGAGGIGTTYWIRRSRQATR